MASPYTQQTFGDDDSSRQQVVQSPQKQHPTDIPTNFVLGRPHTGPGRSNGTQQAQRYGGGSHVLTTEADHSVALLEHLSQDFATLLNRTDISDCFLNVKGVFMAVHRCILAARSSAFSAVVSGNFNRLEGNTRDQLETLTHKDKLVIVINKTEPEIMKQVVMFMYTSKCELNDGNAYALLDAAGRYDIKDLKVHTGRFLASRIDTNNVLMLLKAAFKYENKLVKQRCIEYFIQNAKDIMAMHELWKRFAEEEQALVTELLYWLVNKDLFYAEKPRWEAISHW